jgi:hypothetical protein
LGGARRGERRAPAFETNASTHSDAAISTRRLLR